MMITIHTRRNNTHKKKCANLFVGVRPNVLRGVEGKNSKISARVDFYPTAWQVGQSSQLSRFQTENGAVYSWAFFVNSYHTYMVP